MRAQVGALAVALACVTGLVQVPAEAARSNFLTVAPTPLVVGQTFTLRGTAPGARRRDVVLDVARNGAWRRLAAARTTTSGAFVFKRAATTQQKFRVIAPGVAKTARRARLPRWVSHPVVVKPFVQTAVLSRPSVLEGEAFTMSATLAPAIPGRAVRLQRLVAGAWSTVATRPQDTRGRVAFQRPAGSTGTGSYRVVAPAVQGRAQVASRSVDVVPQARLARVVIQTDDKQDITSGTAYSHASLTIDPRGSGLPAYAGTSRFRVRGNSTAWVAIKRSYKVKLDTSSPVLGMPKSKDWALLANFYDRSMLRNDTAFEVSRRVGLPWTPRMTDVELWLNGTYRGLYQLGESVEVDGDRVDIETPDDPSDGGYLLEADSWPDDKPSFTTDRGLQIYVSEPEPDEDQADAYVATVEADVQEFEDALYGPDFTDPDVGYRHFVDVDGFVDWYLVQELMKNNDSSFNNSCWMYRDEGGLLTMGPVWDFDSAAGNRTQWELTDPTGWFVRRNWSGVSWPFWPGQMHGEAGHWLNRMFEDPWFVARVEERWSQVRSSLLTIPAYTGSRATAIAPAAGRNFAPISEGGAEMPINGTILDGDGVFHGSWTAEAEALQAWLTTRIAWMDAQLS